MAFPITVFLSRMRTARCLFFMAIAAAPAHALAGEAKIQVLPFAPLSGEVPVAAGEKTARLLSAALENLGIAAPVPGLEPDGAAQRALESARKAIALGRGLEGGRDFVAAAASYRGAIESFTAAAPLLADAVELSDAHVALGAALYRTGEDAEAEQELGSAVSLTPLRPFAGEATSPLFALAVKTIRQRAQASERAALRLDSTPPRARVELDGVELGRTPLEVFGIPGGEHLWRVLLPTSTPRGGVLRLSGERRERIEVALGGSAPAEKLIAALSAGRLGADGLALAHAVVASAGGEPLVLGALGPRGPDLQLESFLYHSAKGTLVRLHARSFDAELLSAGTALFELAREIAARLEEPGDPVALPALVLARDAQDPATAGVELTRVAYGSSSAPGERRDAAARGPRRPIDPNRARPINPREK
jgi:predicted small integral membrane protein